MHRYIFEPYYTYCLRKNEILSIKAEMSASICKNIYIETTVKLTRSNQDIIEYNLMYNYDEVSNNILHDNDELSHHIWDTSQRWLTPVCFPTNTQLSIFGMNE